MAFRDAFFLHDPEETPTPRLLERVGVLLTVPDGFTHPVTVGAATLAGEGNCSADVVVEASSDDVRLDVRDSAHSWIRIAFPGRVLVKAGVFFRVVQDTCPRPARRHGFIAPADKQPYDSAVIVSEPRPATGVAVRANGPASFAPRWDGSAEGLTASELETPYWRHAGAKHTRDLVCDICNVFYELGWASGTGGSISIRHGSRTYMAPSGVQKERMLPQDIYALDEECEPLYTPMPRWPGLPVKLSECAPLFSLPYSMREAGACLHSHSQAAVAVTLLHDEVFRVTHLEMIKGLLGHGYHDVLEIPIINNTARECMLVDSMREAMIRYPKAQAVLVRRHGVYIWGATWEKAKAQAECLHYLFEMALTMRSIGVDHGVAPANTADCNSAPVVKESVAVSVPAAGRAPKRPREDESGFHGAKHPSLMDQHSSSASASSSASDVPRVRDADVVLLDIEGCTTPISFVHQVLFPYARSHVRSFLEATFDSSDETRADLDAIEAQLAADKGAGMSVLLERLPADRDGRIQAAVKVVEEWMSKDRKAGCLKQLQGHVWRDGYATGALSGEVFEDVPSFLESVTAAGRRACLYSSGSREAQRLLFQRARVAGDAASLTMDLRPRLSAYFDTTSGPKTDTLSYANIALSLGVDAHRVLFATDALAEAEAAHRAGMKVVLTVRPGNAPLTGVAPFPVVQDLRMLVH
jgi:methylthioribulose 1-phosphate dehydratase / enolase-phosphatase E1